MKKETWLKIGSVIIYLFAPTLVFRLLFYLIEVLFLVQITESVSLSIISTVTLFTFIFGGFLVIMDEYILKQNNDN